ncbi:hypothetical protein ACROYT_G025095 [Oculina patagonica]
MSSIVTAVLKSTIGLLVNKGRDKAAEKLKDGDVTDQRVRELIVREIDDIKSKLDGLARKDLLTSISYLKRGVAYLFELLNKVESGKDGPEECLQVHDLCSTPTVAAGKTVSLAKGMKNLQLTQLDDADKRALSNAKEEFKVSCLKATEAFNNEALSTIDRIQAMVIRVAATILEKVDHPKDAIAAGMLCLEELHSMPAVQGSFAVEFKKGFWARFSKAERREIIFTVYRLNRVVYDVTQLVCGFKKNKWILNWPHVDYREETVDVLRDPRVAETLRKLGMWHYWMPVYVSWSFGQQGEHRLEDLVAVTSTSEGQFIVADLDLKVFDSSGNFSHYLHPETNCRTKICDVATDRNDNIYVLVELNPISFPVSDVFELTKIECCLFCFGKTANLPCKVPLTVGHRYHSLTVSDNNKVLLLGRGEYPFGRDTIDVFKTDGEFVRCFGEKMLSDALDITAVSDSRVMVLDRGGSLVQVFDDEGYHISQFPLETSCKCTKIAFDWSNEHVVVVGDGKLLVCTTKGQFVRTIDVDAKKIQGITVLPDHHIGVACIDHCGKSKVLVF